MPTANASPVRHVIDLDAMLEFIEDDASRWQTYASDGFKRIEFRHVGGYRVKVRDVFVYVGTDGSTAVRHYNEAL